jgi:hypothetical protein
VETPGLVSAPFDAQAIVDQVRLAFRPPLVSPEFGVDVPVYVPAYQYQNAPAVAHDGTNFLVVWQDIRSGRHAIYATRVDHAGTVLDSPGIILSTSASLGATLPAVAYNGHHFLVVWKESRSNYNAIHGRRVSSTGTPLDDSDIVISLSSIIGPGRPALAYNGSHFLIVWQDYRSGTHYDIYGARVDDTGKVLDPSNIALSTAARDQASPSVAQDGKDFLVVWHDFRDGSGYSDVQGTRVDDTGKVLDPDGLVLSMAAGDQKHPAVAYDGTQFLVVWSTVYPASAQSPWGTPTPPHPDAQYGMFATRVSRTGSVLDSTPSTVGYWGTSEGPPSVVYDGKEFSVFWADGVSMQTHRSRVSSAGTMLDHPPREVFSVTGTPAVAYGGGRFSLAWESHGGRNSGSNIYGARMDGTGTVLDNPRRIISTSASEQRRPSVAHDGNNFLVVWQDYRNGHDDAYGTGNSDIYGARVSRTGTLLDTTAIAISTAPGNQLAPVATFDGNNFLVVWMDGRGNVQYRGEVYGARVSRTGTVLDTNGIALSSQIADTSFPAVASNGALSLVLWSGHLTSTTRQDILGVRVDQTGKVLDSPALTLSNASNAAQPAVAYGEHDFFVVWTSSGGNIHGTRVDGLGTVLDATPIAISTAVQSQSGASVAYDGTNFLTVWMDQRNTGSAPEYDIYGARVSRTGTVLDGNGIAICTKAERQIWPRVVHDGSHFLVAWIDDRAGKSMDEDIYGARVDGAGTVLDSDGLAISTALYPESAPSLASLGGRKSLIVYGHYDDSSSTRSPRALARFVQTPNRPPVAHVPGVPTDEDTPVSIPLTGTDEDGDTLTYTVLQPPAHGSLRGTPPDLTYHPAADFHGSDSFSFSVDDGMGDSATDTVSLTVAPVNDAPVALVSSAPEALEGASVHFTASAEDPDGDSLSYTWDFGDGSAPVEGSQVTHVYADDGTHTVKVTARDSAGASAQAAHEVRVGNLPPQAESVPAQHTAVAREVSVRLEAHDAAGEKDPLTWTLTEGPGTLSPEGLYTWTPPKQARGDFLVRARVADDEGGTADVLLHITVTPSGGLGCASTGEAASLSSLLLLALASLARGRSRRRRDRPSLA